MYDLEHYIYHAGYGPTNETLGKYIRELFGQTRPAADQRQRRLTRCARAQTVRARTRPRASRNITPEQ